MKLVVAAVRPTPILWRRASGLASPTEVPASTLPARWVARTSEVLSHCRLLIWSSALDWVGGLDAPPTSTIWQAGKTSLRCELKPADRHEIGGRPPSADRWRDQTAGGSIIIARRTRNPRYRYCR